MALAENVIRFLQENKVTVSTAESCTAGLLASTFASVSGCGSVLEGGYVVYSKLAKYNYLGVSLKTMEIFGLTSEEVAREMVNGLARRSHTNFFIAITGTAESSDSLNGVVCFAYGMKCGGNLVVTSETRKFNGDRNKVIASAVNHVLYFIPKVYWMLSERFYRQANTST